MNENSIGSQIGQPHRRKCFYWKMMDNYVEGTQQENGYHLNPLKTGDTFTQGSPWPKSINATL